MKRGRVVRLSSNEMDNSFTRRIEELGGSHDQTQLGLVALLQYAMPALRFCRSVLETHIWRLR